jgi:hypothetical protein
VVLAHIVLPSMAFIMREHHHVADASVVFIKLTALRFEALDD